MITLGIETSCDETSIALLDNEKILVNTIYSQKEHSKYGGVVPELASRAHLDKIDRLARYCFDSTGISPADIELIAVTDCPGLAGALLVGISFALGMHKGWNIPVTGVNHLEGHICSVLLENKKIEFPFLALIVSGGHTALYRVETLDDFYCLGETVDDAAGEAFDKVGKMLGFSYPAGGSIEKEAAKYEENKTETPVFPVARCSQGAFHFSFSGLKTAVKYFIAGKEHTELMHIRPAICYAFQQSIAEALIANAQSASNQTGIKRLVLVGGVACNNNLRQRFYNEFQGDVFIPPSNLCTDNAAMIALAGYLRFKRNKLRRPKMSPNKTL